MMKRTDDGVRRTTPLSPSIRSRHDDVDALGGMDTETGWSRHVLDVVDPHASGVDDALRVDFVGFVALDIAHHGADHTVAVLEERLDPGGGGNRRAMMGGGSADSHRVTGIVDLGVVVEDSPIRLDR